MNFTIFGYPKTGKTTLFNILTDARIEVKSYDSGKSDPNLRTCPVPDPRLEKIWDLYRDKEKKTAFIDYVDLAGISYGEVKSESYLNHLRKADGLTHVVRAFQDPLIPHPRGKIDLKADIQSMEEELILADMSSVESRIEKLEKEFKGGKTPEGVREMELLQHIHSNLEKGQAVRSLSLSESNKKIIGGFAFLSQKPVIHIINLDEKDIPLIENPEKLYSAEKERTAVLAFCGKIEMEILELEDTEKELFMQEYGLGELSAPKFLQTSRNLLEVITFFTIGKEEVKAWTIKENTSALNAAGAIHSDIERGFIRAEVISWEQLLNHGSFQKAKENAAVRLEGKEYTVQDGDVIYFRFAK
jgi:GTP-binding protein YchF